MVNFEAGVRSSRLAFALAALSTAAAVHAQPLRLYVDDDAPAGGDGRLWATAFKSVAEAIAAAQMRPDITTPVEIRVAQGTYVNLTSSDGSTVVGSGVSLMGGFAGLLATNPNERNTSRYVSVLSGDRMRNDDGSAASRTDNAIVVVKLAATCRLLSGFEIRGGQVGLYVRGTGRIPIDHCVITANIMTDGVPEPFARAVVYASNAVMSDCRITDNTSALGVLYSTGLVQRTVIAGNTGVSTHWPSIVLSSGTLFQSLVAANVSTRSYTIGGGRLLNCTIVANRAPLAPAAWYPDEIVNCIISRNIATVTLPSHQVLFNPTASFRFVRTHVDNARGDIRVGYNLGQIFPADDSLSGDPQFVLPDGADGDPLTWHDNEYRLRPGSRCIDSAGVDDLLYLDGLTDLEGQVPFDDPATSNRGYGYVAYVDLGAFEYMGRAMCMSDFDNSGELSTRDVIDFLNAWFARDPRTDWDATGTLTATDIVAFLNDWFAGC